jgi:diguanylate cyclase (GGDEF)-like protein
MFMNKDPENPYLDVLFLLCIICYAVGFSDVRLRDADFSKDEIENQLKSSTTGRFSIIYWINMVLMIAGTIMLYLVHFFDASTVYYMITTALAYVIMCKTIQGNMLAEELIARQKDENARLEHMVEEKTKELKEMNEHLEYISNTDVLTGLYNRRYGVELLNRFIKDSDAYPVTLFSLDLNHFKPINDNYGHDVGDVVLQEVGKRLSGLGQDRCTPIRIGGDEFLLIFRNSNQTAIENMASLICKRMDEPIEATVVNEEHGEMHHTLHVSACIGIATFPTDAIDVETLYKMADEALYSIKHKYENSVYQQYSKL